MRDRINRFIDATTDVFAIEVRYHHKCWLKYITNRALTDEKMIHLQNIQVREVQEMFFHHVDEVIFKDHEIRTLQGLLKDYKNLLNNYGWPPSDIRSSYIKDLLVREFGDSIGFHSKFQRNESEIVYDCSAGGSYIDAALSSIGISDEQLARNLAPRLSASIKETTTIPWPPRVDELEEDENLEPLLLQFLVWLKEPGRTTEDYSPEIIALASMITKYVTGRRTTTTCNLSVDVHGLTKNKELVDVLHKLGIGISYKDVLLVYDAWAVHDLQLSSSCPYELATGVPAIAILDNDDFKTDTLTGTATQAHRTNVMYIQRNSLELKPDETNGRECDAKQLSETLKNLASDICEVEPYKSPKERAEPPTRSENANDSYSADVQRKRSVIHVLARANNDGIRPSVTDQKVPGYAGFQACLSPPVECSKAYYHVTYPVPPTKSVIHDIMSKMNQAMDEKDIPYAVLVGDMPVYKHIMALKCENRERFDDIIPFLAPFHTHLSFINAMYKRFKDSGIADILVAAGVIADGSVDQALRGKHYRRAIRCLRLMTESLLQCRVKTLQVTGGLEQSVTEKLAILRDLDKAQPELAAAHASLEQDEGLMKYISEMFTEVEGSSMSKYWLSFMDMTDVLMMNIHAIHTCNWMEFLSSMRAMLPWLVIYDNNEYGRWLPDFWAMLASLPNEKITFLSRNFAQSMTGLPYSCLALDMWIETTMNRGSKLKAGWLAILDNEKQLLTNTRNANNVARVRATVMRRACQKKQKQKHVECGPLRMRTDEQAVQNIIACMEEFGCDPFDLSDITLRTLQSALPASQELEHDLLTALNDGKAKVEVYLGERIYSKCSSIYDTVHKNSRLTFAHNKLLKPSGENSKQRVGEMERGALAAIVDLVEISNLVDLTQIMKHRITAECLPIFNVNGTFRKVQKSKLLEKLSLDPVNAPQFYTALVDVGLIWHLATPTPEDREKRDGTVFTWGDYIDTVICIVLNRHADAQCIIWVNDPYDLPYSIKDNEREMRSQGSVPNVYMKMQDPFPSASDFKLLLSSSGNKMRIQALIKGELGRQALHHRAINKRMIFSNGQTCIDLTTGVALGDLQFDQAEADTIMLSAYSKLRSTGTTVPFVIDSEDTDVYVQAAYVSHHVRGDLYIKRKQTFLHCRDLCSPEEADILIQFHALTGCDHNAGFYGHSKKAIYNKVQQEPEARALMSRCGESLILADEVMEDLHTFVLLYVYGAKSSSIEEARAAKWKQLKKKCTLRLPPDQDSLNQHCERANYLAYIQLNYDLAGHPSPVGHGWELANGKCKPVRYTCDALPTELPHMHNLVGSDSHSDIPSDAEDDSSLGSDSEYSISDLDD